MLRIRFTLSRRAALTSGDSHHGFAGASDYYHRASARRVIEGIEVPALILTAADDPFVPAKDLTAFEDEMRRAGVDWQLVSYGGAVHAFTQKGAGSDNSKGAAYNERADRRSWEAMKAFFAEIFR